MRAWVGRTRLIRRGEERMSMRGNLLRRQGHRFHTAGFRQYETTAKVDRQPAPQIRQREGALAIAAIGRADEVKKRLVLRDGEQLPLAKHPAGRRKIAGEHPNL